MVDAFMGLRNDTRQCALNQETSVNVRVRQLTALGLLAFCSLALARDLGQDEALRLREQGAILPLEQLLEMAQKRHPGSRLLEAELEEDDDIYVYEVELLTTTGEDHVPLADELIAGLSRQGYAVDWLADGRDALYQGQTEPYDLIILDLGLPGIPGIEVLKQWRAKGLATPVLILTARSSWAERIEGLKAGADDYLTKPFHPEELQLRVQALLRRSHGQPNQPLLESAGLQLDESRQCVTRDGADIQLTAAEFRLLRYFMLHPQQILSKSHLAEHLYDGETERDSNVLEVHVNHLRRKLGREVIETRRGQGYIFGTSSQ